MAKKNKNKYMYLKNRQDYLTAIFNQTHLFRSAFLHPNSKDFYEPKFLYYPRPMDPAKHGDTQIFPFFDCF